MKNAVIILKKLTRFSEDRFLLWKVQEVLCVIDSFATSVFVVQTKCSEQRETEFIMTLNQIWSYKDETCSELRNTFPKNVEMSKLWWDED